MSEFYSETGNLSGFYLLSKFFQMSKFSIPPIFINKNSSIEFSNSQKTYSSACKIEWTKNIKLQIMYGDSFICLKTE